MVYRMLQGLTFIPANGWWIPDALRMVKGHFMVATSSMTVQPKICDHYMLEHTANGVISL